MQVTLAVITVAAPPDSKVIGLISFIIASESATVTNAGILFFGGQPTG